LLRAGFLFFQMQPAEHTNMSDWYYRQGDQAVDPFEKDVLEKLSQAGIIDASTAVKHAVDGEWKTLGEVLRNGGGTQPQGSSELVVNAPRFYYLADHRQPVGPFDLATLRRLFAEGRFTRDTLVSGIGEPDDLTMGEVLVDFVPLSKLMAEQITQCDICKGPQLSTNVRFTGFPFSLIEPPPLRFWRWHELQRLRAPACEIFQSGSDFPEKCR
jgi:hypothetical protein